MKKSIFIATLCILISSINAQNKNKSELSYKELTGIWEIKFGDSIERAQEILTKRECIFSEPSTHEQTNITVINIKHCTYANYEVNEINLYFYENSFYFAEIDKSYLYENEKNFEEAIKVAYALTLIDTFPMPHNMQREIYSTPNGNTVTMDIGIELHFICNVYLEYKDLREKVSKKLKELENQEREINLRNSLSDM